MDTEPPYSWRPKKLVAPALSLPLLRGQGWQGAWSARRDQNRLPPMCPSTPPATSSKASTRRRSAWWGLDQRHSIKSAASRAQRLGEDHAVTVPGKNDNAERCDHPPHTYGTSGSAENLGLLSAGGSPAGASIRAQPGGPVRPHPTRFNFGHNNVPRAITSLYEPQLMRNRWYRQTPAVVVPQTAGFTNRVFCRCHNEPRSKRSQPSLTSLMSTCPRGWPWPRWPSSGLMMFIQTERRRRLWAWRASSKRYIT